MDNQFYSLSYMADLLHVKGAPNSLFIEREGCAGADEGGRQAALDVARNRLGLREAQASDRRGVATRTGAP